MSRTESGLEFEPVYGPNPQLGHHAAPGEFPFTRGIHPGMYTDKLWTMRQYAGFGTAAATNERFLELIAAGGTGLSVAFDLPTQMGLDSDDPRSLGEVGRVGVAIDSIADMRRLFADIDLGAVSTSMTINAPAAVLLCMYEIVAEENGVAADRIRGTIQNDVLKEFIARGTYIFPPTASVRLALDTVEYCADRMPKFNAMSISGYHMAEAGANPVQEVAFTFANALEYLRGLKSRGANVEMLAQSLAFFFVSRVTILEEVAKFRAARQIWAQLMRDDFGFTEPRALHLRFHTQTAGVQLSAREPELNIARVAVQALAAVLGGTQSLHTNSFDEALAIPTSEAARLALHTQLMLAHETDVAATVDPFAGSYAIEALTADLAAAITAELDEIEKRGGALAALELKYQKSRIEASAYKIAREYETGDRIMVGQNKFEVDEPVSYVPYSVDPELEKQQVAELAAFKSERDQLAVERALDTLGAVAASSDNVVPFIKQAVIVGATIGEICTMLRHNWGTAH